jgi:hypothetical protein
MLIAFVPASGIDRSALPEIATAEQVSGLTHSAEAWPGQPFLSITWKTGGSAGPLSGDRLIVRRQLAVLKGAREAVTVKFERDSSGKIVILDLR